MKKIIVKLMAMVMVAAVALPTMAQFGNQEQAVALTTTFQSTGSTMMSSGSSYSATPTLNEDGTAAYEGASYTPTQAPARGPRRVGGQTIEGTPIGDAVLPLMLLACAYLILRAVRRHALS